MSRCPSRSTQGFGSCQTLQDGIDFVNRAGQPDSKELSEEDLLKQIQELDAQIALEAPATPKISGDAQEPPTISSAETLPASTQELDAAKSTGQDKSDQQEVEPGTLKPVATPARSLDQGSAPQVPKPPRSLTESVPETPPTTKGGGKPMTDRKAEWEKGNKNQIADLLCSANFDKEAFLNSLHIVVTKKKVISLEVEEGWYSESELRDEAGWSQAKINGAKAYCLSLPETHVRKNLYDNEEEYWVVLKETGKRKEEQSFEEIHKRQKQADGEPSWNLDKSFKSMGAYEARADHQNKVGGPKPGEQSKYTQVKDSLGRFMESMMAKTGTMRKLVRELKNQYDDPAAQQCVVTLEAEIKKVDQQYDACNEAWAKGEAEKFASDEFVKEAEAKMKTATFVCSKAAAAELKVRNAKKYYDKKKPDAKAKADPARKEAAKPKRRSAKA